MIGQIYTEKFKGITNFQMAVYFFDFQSGLSILTADEGFFVFVCLLWYGLYFSAL